MEDGRRSPCLRIDLEKLQIAALFAKLVFLPLSPFPFYELYRNTKRLQILQSLPVCPPRTVSFPRGGFPESNLRGPGRELKQPRRPKIRSHSRYLLLPNLRKRNFREMKQERDAMDLSRSLGPVLIGCSFNFVLFGVLL